MNTRVSLRQSSRRGVTMLEVLVVIGVVGLLASLLLPAVMTSRATSQRLQCVNNLKQIALASQNFESVRGHLPGASLSPLDDLLPYLEQPNLKTEFFSTPIPPRLLLPVILCPASDILPYESAPVHYLVNHGTDLSWKNGLVSLRPDNPLRSRDVTDGLSMTAYFSERPQAFHYEPLRPNGAEEFEAACRRDPIRCVWHLKGSYSVDAPEAFASACRDAGQRTGLFPAVSSGYFQLFVVPQATYGHFLPPNTPGCYFEDPNFPAAHTYTAWSRHAGGVNVALCDGSARFVSNAISLASWQALGTRNGNDHVDAF
ncbi:hypothetical protein Pan44_55070 [Caulifigura coniformis]|uniref:DUF1559 domain-containing protein n=1 Tax=Caulifigura coniformis TaxID=2527983 RepID=A0A517SMU1_9PLAN|nr:DUF1559 domain-containing protein [Caulifigura coniformis]QDT57438.1 hypothetical protein Pan44_55070 [Caulifigura coniformis]